MVAIFFEMGVDLHMIKAISANPVGTEIFFSHSLTLKLMAALAATLVTILCALAVGFSPETVTLVFFAAVCAAANSIVMHAKSLFRAHEIMRYEAQSIVLEKISILAICGTILLLTPTVAWFVNGIAAATAITAFATLIVVRRKVTHWKLNYNWRFVRDELLRPGLPFAFLNIVIVLYFRSGPLLLGLLSNDDQSLGHYSAGFRIVEAYIFVPMTLMAPLYPVLSRERDNPQRLAQILDAALRTLSIISISIALPLFWYADFIIPVILGDNYASGGLTIVIVVLSIIPMSMTSAAGGLAAMIGRQNRVNRILLFVTALSLTSYLVLIPLFGTVGAAITALVTEFTLAVLSAWVVRDYLKPNRMARLAFALGFVFITLGAWRNVARDLLPDWLSLSLCMLLLILTIVTSGLLKTAEIARMWGKLREVLKGRK